jgi:ATP-GRASP peptide maturase of grasp-with-spasm system
MKEKPHIGTFHTRAVNKLKVLYEAAKLGIEIPETLVTAKKKLVLEYSSKNIISKSIYEGFKCKIKNGNYTLYTEKVVKRNLKATFFPTLFQSTIEKEADIRSFYLDGKFYSMAIRSQSAEQTETDFRKYLKDIQNRSFSFKLPTEIEDKLHQLMLKIGLNTGSIDIIFTKDGRFVFLEVNPVGQFGMTSIPCNYYLEKAIAEKLSNSLLV